MKKSKLTVLLIMISATAIVLSGCYFLDFIFGPEPEEKEDPDKDTELEEREKDEPTEKEAYDLEGKRKTMFYLFDGNHNLVPVKRPIEWTEAIATKTANKMTQTPENENFWQETGLSPTLPENAKVMEMAINNGTARVDFSEGLMDLEPELEEEIINSVIYTLTEFDSIEEVEIMVEGQLVETLPGGTDVSSALSPDGLNVEVTAEAESKETGMPVKLYFVSDDYLVPVTRYIANTEEVEGNAIYELMKGADPESGLESYISPELDINQVAMDETTMQIDLSNLTEEEDPETTQYALKQINFTLTELDHIEDVQISVDGTLVELEQEVMTIEQVNFRY